MQVEIKTGRRRMNKERSFLAHMAGIDEAAQPGLNFLHSRERCIPFPIPTPALPLKGRVKLFMRRSLARLLPGVCSSPFKGEAGRRMGKILIPAVSHAPVGAGHTPLRTGIG